MCIFMRMHEYFHSTVHMKYTVGSMVHTNFELERDDTYHHIWL